MRHRAAEETAAVQGDLASAGAWAAFTLNMLNLVGVAVIVARTVLADARRVLAWAHRHAQEYGDDPTTVFLAGSSAGGHLAADVALTPGEDVTAAILLGAYLGPVADRPSSPYDLVRPDAPPFLVVHGRNDSLVPAAQAHGFVTALRRVGTQTVVYAELPGTQHGFDRFHSVRFEAIIDAIESFCVRVLERRS